MGSVGKVLPWLCGVVIGACAPSDAPSRRLLFDFESDEGWKASSGNLSAVPTQRPSDIHRHGASFLGSGETLEDFDIERHGVLVSPVFEIDHDFLIFRAGSTGATTKCAVDLVPSHGRRVLRKAPATGRWKMETHVLDVADLRGHSVRMRLVDRSDGKPCAIHLDYVRLVDG
jgi:hypothetical protein